LIFRSNSFLSRLFCRKKSLRKNSISELDRENTIEISKVFSRQEINDIIFRALEEIGIVFSQKTEQGNIDLNEYLDDSLQLIMFAVALEQNLGYALTEDILLKENLQSINFFSEILYKSRLGKQLTIATPMH